MPKQKTVTTYTLAELKELHPDGYEAAHERWKMSIALDSAPWSDETMDSLKAVVKACGATLRKWEIGACCYSSLSVSVEDTYEMGEENPEQPKDATWFYDAILRPLGYKGHKEKGVDFPGLCPFTGYCADEDFLEAVYKSLQRDNTLTEALEGLADVASKMMEDDIKQMQDEDSMFANWDGLEFLENGDEA